MKLAAALILIAMAMASVDALQCYNNGEGGGAGQPEKCSSDSTVCMGFKGTNAVILRCSTEEDCAIPEDNPTGGALICCMEDLCNGIQRLNRMYAGSTKAE